MAAEETNGSHSPSRLDRIERIVEVLANTVVDMRSDIQVLMRSQVLMSESLEKLTARVDRLAESQQRAAEAQERLAEAQERLAEAQLHTEERLGTLILTVDEIIRGRKPQ